MIGMRAKVDVYFKNIPTRENEYSLTPFHLQTHLQRCTEPCIFLVLESGVCSGTGAQERRVQRSSLGFLLNSREPQEYPSQYAHSCQCF